MRLRRSSFQAVTPLRFFLTLAPVFGLALLLLTPPFQGGDEPLHFYRAYQVSHLNLVVDKNEGNDFGGVLPSAMVETVNLTTNGPSLGNLKPDAKYDPRTTMEALSLKADPARAEWHNFTATALYSPVAYVPQAAGVLLARILQAPPVVMMYAGRAMNLAVWIALIAVSIRLMPRRKWAVAFIGLLPVALSQAASLSADVMTVGLLALFLAGIFHLMARQKPVSRMELLGLLALMSAMALCKQVTAILLPLIFLVPNKFFEPRKYATVIKAALIAVPVAMYGVWLYIIRDLDMKSVFSRNQNPDLQIDYIIHHPLGFLQALWNTNFFAWGDNVTKSFIGTFGWGDPSIALIFIVAGYIGLFLVLAANTNDAPGNWINGRHKAIIAILGIGYWGAVSAALYAYYNPVGHYAIAGLQGRYFLPLALLAIPVLYGKWLICSEQAYRSIAMGIPALLLIVSVITIFVRYYIANPA